LFPDLDRCMHAYVVDPNYRRELLSKKDQHSFVFMTVNGAPFTGKNFSKYLAGVIQRLTGVKASSNILRSSFVSMLMGDDPSEALKQSAAKLLNHGMRMQSEVYDRRDPAQVIMFFFKVLVNCFGCC
jgi:site-specific recombinase XerD